MEVGRRAFLLSAGVLLTLPVTARLYFAESLSPKVLTLDFRKDLKQEVVLTEDIGQVNLIAPGRGWSFVLTLKQDSVGDHAVVGWPDSVLWLGDNAPTMKDPANSVRLISFFDYGGHYYAETALHG